MGFYNPDTVCLCAVPAVYFNVIHVHSRSKCLHNSALPTQNSAPVPNSFPLPHNPTLLHPAPPPSPLNVLPRHQPACTDGQVGTAQESAQQQTFLTLLPLFSFLCPCLVFKVLKQTELGLCSPYLVQAKDWITEERCFDSQQRHGQFCLLQTGSGAPPTGGQTAATFGQPLTSISYTGQERVYLPMFL
jgi:hypothetical protein